MVDEADSVAEEAGEEVLATRVEDSTTMDRMGMVEDLRMALGDTAALPTAGTEAAQVGMEEEDTVAGATNGKVAQACMTTETRNVRGTRYALSRHGFFFFFFSRCFVYLLCVSICVLSRGNVTQGKYPLSASYSNRDLLSATAKIH
ncbi:hypothetical protein K474DRAFT_1102679 [Panus rudis PR-1116 ss-1]|nr:hypothetical protein K474DRAFT_1102679 [Panus rudis PR-1116 ss-1]